MQDDPAGALREQAREWGRGLLDSPAWAEVSDRVTLLVTSPPTGLEELPPIAAVQLWLSLDAQAARSLTPELSRPLSQGEARVEQHRTRGDLGTITLAVTTDEAVHRLLQGVTRRAAEARWQVRHAEAVADRLHRLEQYHTRAGMLPDDGLERMVRPLWVDAAHASHALGLVTSDRPGDALPGAGEVAAGLCRIACAWEQGAYPPSEYLRAVAAETRIGRRIGPWLDDFVPALGGDEAATRRILGSREQALHEVRQVMAERFRNRAWLNEPEAFALRAPR